MPSGGASSSGVGGGGGRLLLNLPISMYFCMRAPFSSDMISSGITLTHMVPPSRLSWNFTQMRLGSLLREGPKTTALSINAAIMLSPSKYKSLRAMTFCPSWKPPAIGGGSKMLLLLSTFGPPSPRCSAAFSSCSFSILSNLSKHSIFKESGNKLRSTIRSRREPASFGPRRNLFTPVFSKPVLKDPVVAAFGSNNCARGPLSVIGCCKRRAVMRASG
mmetsp:Transcript_23457/g.38522  ORF Transcript_23457/g.38522 Transcript_23457/m.38522 type:complete len:218 (-) Transcript_23457:147-800(-)